jgi:hypothetical protein
MELKKVIVSKHVRKTLEAAPWHRYDLEPVGEAGFHQFGVGYEEFEAGPGNFTTAIVEWPDGRVESVPAEHVRFVTPNVRAKRGQTAQGGT